MFHARFHIKNSNITGQNSVDPGEVAHNEPPHLDLHCFSNSTIFIFGTLHTEVSGNDCMFCCHFFKAKEVL